MILLFIYHLHAIPYIYAWNCYIFFAKCRLSQSPHWNFEGNRTLMLLPSVTQFPPLCFSCAGESFVIQCIDRICQLAFGANREFMTSSSALSMQPGSSFKIGLCRHPISHILIHLPNIVQCTGRIDMVHSKLSLSDLEYSFIPWDRFCVLPLQGAGCPDIHDCIGWIHMVHPKLSLKDLECSFVSWDRLLPLLML